MFGLRLREESRGEPDGARLSFWFGMNGLDATRLGVRSHHGRQRTRRREGSAAPACRGSKPRPDSAASAYDHARRLAGRQPSRGYDPPVARCEPEQLRRHPRRGDSVLAGSSGRRRDGPVGRGRRAAELRLSHLARHPSGIPVGCDNGDSSRGHRRRGHRRYRRPDARADSSGDAAAHLPASHHPGAAVSNPRRPVPELAVLPIRGDALTLRTLRHAHRPVPEPAVLPVRGDGTIALRPLPDDDANAMRPMPDTPTDVSGAEHSLPVCAHHVPDAERRGRLPVGAYLPDAKRGRRLPVGARLPAAQRRGPLPVGAYLPDAERGRWLPVGIRVLPEPGLPVGRGSLPDRRGLPVGPVPADRRVRRPGRRLRRRGRRRRRCVTAAERPLAPAPALVRR
jgi:hypothetical protein